AQIAEARTYIAASLDEQQACGLCTNATATQARITYADTVEQAVGGAAWVQEQLPEKLQLKRDMFERLDALAPADAIVASSTSAIPASQFTETLAGRSRCLVAHPVNPPHLVPVVELCGAPWTAPDTVARAHGVMSD